MHFTKVVVFLGITMNYQGLKLGGSEMEFFAFLGINSLVFQTSKPRFAPYCDILGSMGDDQI